MKLRLNRKLIWIFVNIFSFQSGLPPNWWQVNGDTDQNEKEITVEFSRDEVAENNGIENGINGVSQADSSDHNKYHKYSPLNIGPVPAHI